MFRLICKRLQHRRPLASTSAHGYLFCTSSLKPKPDDSQSTNPASLTVSYLLKSCGLSSESAISASKKLQFETTDQPDTVLNLLKSNGFTQAQIKNLITIRPLILLADPNKTLKPNIDLLGSLGISGANLVKVIKEDPRILETDVHAVVEFFRGYGFTESQISMLTTKRPRLYLNNAPKNFKPKLEYFKSLGLSGAEIAEMISYAPYILQNSLENRIMPSVEAIRRVVGTDGNVLKAIKRGFLYSNDLEKVLEPNVEILMNHGVPASMVLKLMCYQPMALLVTTQRLSETVVEVEKMGFNPTKMVFVLAIRALVCMSKSLWQRKLGVYCSFGMSVDEILSAFKSQPMCMIISEKKIRKLVGFFVNELKLNPSMISKNPDLLLLSLEKRIIPRCSVLELLMSKDIIRGRVRLAAFRITEQRFVEKFVSKHHNVIPEVVEVHQGKIQFQAFPTLAENMNSSILVGSQHCTSRSSVHI